MSSGSEAMKNLTKEQQSITNEHQRMSSEIYAREQKVSKARKETDSSIMQVQNFTLCKVKLSNPERT